MRTHRRFTRRKRESESSDNHERWLLTYADMITLLLGLFIILYSISNVDKQKLESVADAIRSGFGFGPGGTVAIFDGGTSVLEDDLFKPKSQLFRVWENLGFNLKRWKEVAKLRLGLAETEELKLVIFGPITDEGDWIVDQTQDETFQNLSQLTENLDVEILIRLEIPENARLGRVSWEDSAKRTAKLAELMETKYNIPREKIAILAHTKFSPMKDVSSDSPEAKARQERIEIFIRKQK
ncbi:flagellar motor protein MotB [Leptospira sp. GIMC2001]|uniref:flagellar motor protein MotB n=1 Tax=Leptospira sp. GIMC2001 TaxID=1513297 RepID=UPI0004A5C688|nr:flagellar motor protein MotB [Leptospira sp. GIMC2001]AID56217.1 flagellar motor protein MotB [Leptospira sp. GIMC2001]WCL49725.1 endoflagellar motor protein [Leptospira sp. GIMC2001]